MSQHTPGPWYVGASMNPAYRPFGICREIPAEQAGLGEDDGPGEETIAEVCPTSSPETAAADARLIAAAPDLLAACEALVTLWGSPEPFTGADALQAIGEATERARAAIAKAREGATD